MYLDYYPEMTEKLLTEYAQRMLDQYHLLELLVIHRTGEIYPDDSIVLVATWSPHRAEVFHGCRDMMEYLKSKATFWKRETLVEQGEGQNKNPNKTSSGIEKKALLT